MFRLFGNKALRIVFISQREEMQHAWENEIIRGCI
jgi:hypothetical protein